MPEDRFRKQLEQWYWWGPTERLPKAVLKERYLARIDALEEPLRTVGRRLLGLIRREWDSVYWNTCWMTPDVIAFDELPAAERRKLFQVFFPAMADWVEWAWQYLRELPYWPTWFTEKPYRAPREPKASLPKRASWLEALVQTATRFRDDVFEPAWIAAWVPHFKRGYGEGHAAGRFLGAVLARQGDPVSEDVFRILVESANNTHEVGRMGTHVLVALASSPRAEAWEFLERLLLAAQRQEGLRQSIFSAVANGHLGALKRLLTCIVENRLVRFSSVVQALQNWMSLALSALQPARVKQVLSLLTRCLQDEAERRSALASSEPLEVYAALWCAGVEDVSRGIELAEALLQRKEPKVRFAAAYFLACVELEAADCVLCKAIHDDDPAIALQGITGLTRCLTVHHTAAGASSWDRELADQLEAIRERLRRELPKSSSALDPLWERAHRNLSSVDWALAHCLQFAPAERLAASFPALEPRARGKLVRLLAARARREPAVRRFLLNAFADRSTWIQETVAEALAKVKLSQEELRIVESSLTRRGQALRMKLLELILRHDDEMVLESARSLLKGNQQQRLAGMELLEQLVAAGRSRDRCRQLLEDFLAAEQPKASRRGARRGAGKKGTTAKDLHTRATRLLEDLRGSSSRRELSNETIGPDTAFGLLQGERLTPPLRPRKRRIVLATDAAAGVLQSLDDLIEKHRDEPLYSHTDEYLLGEETRFPEPDWWLPRQQNERRLPLRALWEKWAEDEGRPRDPDGLELVRAYLWPELWPRAPKLALRTMQAERKPPRLRYSSIVHAVLHWLLYLSPPPKSTAFVLDLCETVLYTAERLAERKAVESGQEGSRAFESAVRLARLTLSWISELVAADLERADKRQLERAWRLVRWAEETFEGEDVLRSLELLKQMSLAGVVTDGDWYDHLLGKNHTEFWRGGYSELDSMTAYGPGAWNLVEYIARVPQVARVLDRCRERILEIELARGDHPSPATDAALSLGSLFGVKPLLQILRALGDTPLRLDSPVRGTRGHSFAWLLYVTYPAEEDTPEVAAQKLRGLVENEGLPEDRLVELGLIAPQWAPCVEIALGWPGYCSAVAWLRFHTVLPDPAAIPYMLPAEQRTRHDRRPDYDDLLRQYSDFSVQDFYKGVVDAVWFRRFQDQLGSDRWDRLLKAVKTFTTPQRAARVSMISDALLGKANRDQLIQEVSQKRKRLAVQLLGLLPLRRGRERKKDLIERYQVLQEYRDYATTLGPLSRPDALEAAEAGLKNLASTAGYPDELRMEWELGAARAKRLLKGKRTARQGDVVVRMEVDDLCRPTIVVERGGKPLRRLPRQLKKDPEIAELYERAAEIQDQSSRARRTLEAMMCRATELSAEELRQLCGHPIVGPLLTRLVLVGQGIMGYPDHGGRALRDHQGKLEPLKPGETLRIAHPVDFWKQGLWSEWQHECFVAERIQPFKQVFRELYVVTRQEKQDRTSSRRYAGHQVQPRQAAALWSNRDWRVGDPNYAPEISKDFPDHDIYVQVEVEEGITTPLEVEGWLIEGIVFYRRSTHKRIPLVEVPPIIFSEVMRDVDLVVSVAHVGGVEPEATASTVEMRARLVLETCQLLGLNNVEIKKNRAFIEGTIGRYTVHLGSGVVHKMPGGAVCLVPVPSQHRGRLFLPFADDDPKTAEVISKVLMLARDDEIQDPILLEQLRA